MLVAIAPGRVGPAHKTPGVLVALLVGVRVAAENRIGHVGGEVPYSAWFIGLGDGQSNLREITDVIAVFRVDGQGDAISLLQVANLGGRFGFGSECDVAFLEDPFAVAMTLRNPPGDTVAARWVSMGDPAPRCGRFP